MIINLKYGYPTKKEVIKILEDSLEKARLNCEKVLVLIHGYELNGIGGRIKLGVKKLIDDKKRNKQIKDYIDGENFDLYNDLAREIIDKFPNLKEYYGKCNGEITIIIV